jgi:tetratricopeptide (TPR) repeat protein
MSQDLRRISLVFLCFLGLIGCARSSGEHSDQAVSKSAPAKIPAAGVPNYPTLTADQWLSRSQTLFQEGKYVESVGAAQTALYLKPDFAEAYNNIGAAYAALHMWDAAVQADQQALRLNPNMQLARNNLAWALTQKSLEKR